MEKTKQEHGKVEETAGFSKEASVRYNNAAVSTKHCIDICKFLKGKKPEQAIHELNEVLHMKKVIPMRNREIPHKKGIPGRYPVKAAGMFVKLIRSLEANANVKNMKAENIRLYAKADKASQPHRPGRFRGRRFKRTHITIIGREVEEKSGEKK